MVERNPYVNNDEESLAIRDLVHDGNLYLSELTALVTLVRHDINKLISAEQALKINERLDSINKAEIHIRTIDEFYFKWKVNFDSNAITKMRYIKRQMKWDNITKEEAEKKWNEAISNNS